MAHTAHTWGPTTSTGTEQGLANSLDGQRYGTQDSSSTPNSARQAHGQCKEQAVRSHSKPRTKVQRWIASLATETRDDNLWQRPHPQRGRGAHHSQAKTSDHSAPALMTSIMGLIQPFNASQP